MIKKSLILKDFNSLSIGKNQINLRIERLYKILTENMGERFYIWDNFAIYT